jgi:hypothetical protein
MQILREASVAGLPSTLGHQPRGAIALVGVAESPDLPSGDAKKLASLPALETALEHAPNDLEAVHFLSTHRHQLLGQHPRERAR